jgi:hypothetical protein
VASWETLVHHVELLIRVEGTFELVPLHIRSLPAFSGMTQTSWIVPLFHHGGTNYTTVPPSSALRATGEATSQSHA